MSIVCFASQLPAQSAPTYSYRSDGLRAQKMVDITRGNTATRTITHHEWDGQNLVMDLTGDGDVKAVYLRGASLISQQIAGQLYYYTFNAHGDVVQRVGQTGAAGPKYKYDAFGNQRGTSETDPNPFRYCGEYFDSETGTVYLRNRNYDTATGRFSSEDTHWNAENRIYGDKPQRINEEPERFKYAKTVVGNEENERGKGTLLPDISAIRQSGNLYEYCMGNPVRFIDRCGEIAIADDCLLLILLTIILLAVAVMPNPATGTQSNGLSMQVPGVDLSDPISKGGEWVGETIDSAVTWVTGIFLARNKYGNKTVGEVLKTKRGSIKNAPLPPGGPNWQDLLPIPMETVRKLAQKGETGYREIWKLLTDKRFDR